MYNRKTAILLHSFFYRKNIYKADVNASLRRRFPRHKAKKK
jgi:hypothetical protein